MKKIPTLMMALFVAVTVAAPLVCQAELYKRAGGTAFHVRKDCPALSGYKIVPLKNADGLLPCRICDQKEFNNLAASKVAAKKAKNDRPRTIQEMAGTHKEEPKAAPQRNYDYDHSREFPPGYENGPVHDGLNGQFVVNNGQKVFINGEGHNAGGAGVVVNGKH